MAVATFAGGCFWCLDAVFSQLAGVYRVTSGYCGGYKANPTYEEGCSGATGHAEAVRIDFNSELISYRQLLEVFFAIHDPTTLNRQGADVGTQYRSAIFVHTPEQRREALEMVGGLAAVFSPSAPIVTEIADAPEFYPAESYHQGYFAANPGQGYCTVIINPKVAAFRRKFSALLNVPG